MSNLVYLAHPAGAPTKEAHLANLARAKRWFRWIIDLGHPVVADWILACEVWDDFDANQRERGLSHDDEHIKRCDAYWMVGGRISDGMARGLRTALIPTAQIVVDLTPLGEEPPEVYRAGWRLGFYHNRPYATLSSSFESVHLYLPWSDHFVILPRPAEFEAWAKAHRYDIDERTLGRAEMLP